MKIFRPLTLIGILISSVITAQSLDRQVIASAGQTDANGTLQLTYTIGEPIIGPVSATVTIDQGFLAAASSNTALGIEDEILNSAIRVYPNPVSENLAIDLNSITGTTTITIYDSTGKLQLKEKLSQNKNSLNLSRLANGLYLVRLSFSDYKPQKAFKIIKY